MTQFQINRNILLCILCISQFLDTFNSSAFFAAIPTLARAIHLSPSDSVWLVSAYQITFSGFLLLSGRATDVLQNAKLFFCCGTFAFGLFAVILGLITNTIPFLILRALTGIAAAFTIPSALNVLVQLFPSQPAQATAIAVFGGSVALGNILGLVLGAIMTQYASWNWIFFFEAILAIPISIFAFFSIPTKPPVEDSSEDKRRLDWFGILILTAFLLLFTLGLTSAAPKGWRSPLVIAPLATCAALVVVFLLWERYATSVIPAIPRGLWHFTNVKVLCVVSLLPFLWWTVVFLGFTTFWQDTASWTPVKTAVHLLPIGLLGVPTMAISGKLGNSKIRKWILLGGLMLMVVGTILLPFGNTTDRYWRFVFPGFCLGTVGTALVYTQTNITIVAAVPASLAGTIAAVFNTALILGATLGVAIFSAIQSNVGLKSSTPFAGTAAGLWFVCGICGLVTIVVAVFYRVVVAHDDTIDMENNGGSPGDSKSPSLIDE